MVVVVVVFLVVGFGVWDLGLSRGLLGRCELSIPRLSSQLIFLVRKQALSPNTGYTANSTSTLKKGETGLAHPWGGVRDSGMGCIGGMTTREVQGLEHMT